MTRAGTEGVGSVVISLLSALSLGYSAAKNALTKLKRRILTANAAICPGRREILIVENSVHVRNRWKTFGEIRILYPTCLEATHMEEQRGFFVEEGWFRVGGFGW